MDRTILEEVLAINANSRRVAIDDAIKACEKQISNNEIGQGWNDAVRACIEAIQELNR